MPLVLPQTPPKRKIEHESDYLENSILQSSRKIIKNGHLDEREKQLVSSPKSLLLQPDNTPSIITNDSSRNTQYKPGRFRFGWYEFKIGISVLDWLLEWLSLHCY
jgi:hypothetical protein